MHFMDLPSWLGGVLVMKERIPCPPIVVYRAVDSVPDTHLFIAKLFPEITTKNSKTGEVRKEHRPLPIETRGSTDTQAADRMVKFWEGEQDKLDTAHARIEGMAANRKRKSDPAPQEKEV
jgi:hypothetical protein